MNEQPHWNETQDLDFRAADGSEVTLLWEKTVGRVWVAVRNHDVWRGLRGRSPGQRQRARRLPPSLRVRSRAHARAARRGMSTASTSAYPASSDLRVIDAMHPALITCSPDSSLRTIARMMSTYRVHAILVNTHESARKLGHRLRRRSAARERDGEHRRAGGALARSAAGRDDREQRGARPGGRLDGRDATSRI